MVYTYGDDWRMVMDGLWVYKKMFYHVLPTLLLSPPQKTKPNLFEMFAPKKWSCNYFFVDETFWCILKIARSSVMAFGKFEEYALGSIEKYRKFKDFPSKAWRKWQSEFLLIAKWYHVFKFPQEVLKRAETECWNMCFFIENQEFPQNLATPNFPNHCYPWLFPAGGVPARPALMALKCSSMDVSSLSRNMQNTGKSQGNPGETWLFYTHLCSNTLHFQYLNTLSTSVNQEHYRAPQTSRAQVGQGNLHSWVAASACLTSQFSCLFAVRFSTLGEMCRVFESGFPWLSMTFHDSMTHGFSNVAQTFQTVFSWRNSCQAALQAPQAPASALEMAGPWQSPDILRSYSN